MNEKPARVLLRGLDNLQRAKILLLLVITLAAMRPLEEDSVELRMRQKNIITRTKIL
jgi:hypothetical protein